MLIFAICLASGCQSTEALGRTFDYGQAFIPAIQTANARSGVRSAARAP